MIQKFVASIRTSRLKCCAIAGFVTRAVQTELIGAGDRVTPRCSPLSGSRSAERGHIQRKPQAHCRWMRQ